MTPTGPPDLSPSPKLPMNGGRKIAPAQQTTANDRGAGDRPGAGHVHQVNAPATARTSQADSQIASRTRPGSTAGTSRRLA